MNNTNRQATMKKFLLTVNDKTAVFVQRADEDFGAALSRGAAKLGFRGGAFAQPNFAMNHQVTVTDRPATRSNARQAYNGVCVQI